MPAISGSGRPASVSSWIRWNSNPMRRAEQRGGGTDHDVVNGRVKPGRQGLGERRLPQIVQVPQPGRQGRALGHHARELRAGEARRRRLGLDVRVERAAQRGQGRLAGGAGRDRAGRARGELLVVVEGQVLRGAHHRPAVDDVAVDIVPLPRGNEVLPADQREQHAARAHPGVHVTDPNGVVIQFVEWATPTA
jgi:hypothetical protein